MDNNKLDKKENIVTKEIEKEDTVVDNEKNKEQEPKKKNSKARKSLVLLFIALFFVFCYIELRGSYLEFLELGQNYTNIFKTNMIYRYGIMAVIFVGLYFIIYMTNRGIKKGLKPFFEREKKEMPKLPNKSLALVISAIDISFVPSLNLPYKYKSLNFWADPAPPISFPNPPGIWFPHPLC